MVTVQVLTSLQWIIKKETKQKRRMVYVCVAANFNSIPPIEKVRRWCFSCRRNLQCCRRSSLVWSCWLRLAASARSSPQRESAPGECMYVHIYMSVVVCVSTSKTKGNRLRHVLRVLTGCIEDFLASKHYFYLRQNYSPTITSYYDFHQFKNRLKTTEI